MKFLAAQYQGDACLLLALIVLGRWDQLKKTLRAVAQKKMPRFAIEETILQSHLFAGFPRALEAFEVFAAVEASGVFGKQNGLSKEDRRGFEKRGRALFKKIYAGQAEEVLGRIASFHPELKDWIIQHAYGNVLSRGGLSPKQRELASIAALIVSRQWRQLGSHLRGAKRCGASAAEISDVMAKIKSITPPPVLAKARRIAKSL